MEIVTIQSSAPRALTSAIVDNLAGLQQITLAYKRRGAGYTDFACLHLQSEEGAPPKYNQTPTSSADEIVSTCIEQGQLQADTAGYATHIRASFKLSASGNGRARKNPEPVTWPASVNGEDPIEGVDPIERDKVYSLLRDMMKDNNTHTIALVSKVTELVGNLGSVGPVLEGAAKFYSESHRVYREGVDAQADQAFNQAQLDAEVKKWEAIAKSLGPGAGLLFKQIQATMEGRRAQGGPVATSAPMLPSSPQEPRHLRAVNTGSTPTPLPPPKRGASTVLAELVKSLTEEQRAALPDTEVTKALFTSEAKDDAQAGAAFAAFVDGTQALVLAKVYDMLDPAQVGLLTELQESVL